MDPNIIGLIIGIIVAAVTIWLILWGARKDSQRINAAQQQKEAAAPQKSASIESPVIPAAPAAVKPDDLSIVEGIGPKIASLLTQKGIATFAQLAATEVPLLEKILKENGLQFAKPGTWPEQARLAAEGKMDELNALQDKLVAGR